MPKAGAMLSLGGSLAWALLGFFLVFFTSSLESSESLPLDSPEPDDSSCGFFLFFLFLLSFVALSSFAPLSPAPLLLSLASLFGGSSFSPTREGSPTSFGRKDLGAAGFFSVSESLPLPLPLPLP